MYLEETCLFCRLDNHGKILSSFSSALGALWLEYFLRVSINPPFKLSIIPSISTFYQKCLCDIKWSPKPLALLSFQYISFISHSIRNICTLHCDIKWSSKLGALHTNTNENLKQGSHDTGCRLIIIDIYFIFCVASL